MPVEQRTLISTHIPKTAGTSLQSLYQSAVGREHIAIYDARTDTLHRGSESIFTNVSPFTDWLKSNLMNSPFDKIAKDLAFWLKSLKNSGDQVEIPRDVLIIHGHFLANRYDDLVENPLRSIVFRDPLARIHSEYNHWKRAEGRVVFRVTLPYDPSMSFEDYALSQDLQNYQTQAVAGKPLTDFDVVGVTENLDKYKDALIELFIEQGWCDKSVLEAVSMPRFNQTPIVRRTNRQDLSDTFIQQFRSFHNEDYQLYDAAKALLS